MKALILSNGELEVKEIGNELEDLQKIVGGYIEIPFLGDTFADNEIDVVINEEGKLIEGMRPEIAIVHMHNSEVVDVVYGNCIFVSHDDEGETIGLNDEQIDIVKFKLQTIVTLINNNGDEFEVRALFI